MDITQQQVDEFVSKLPRRAHVVALPLRTRFRGIQSREAMLIDAPGGWVEFAPFVEYGAEESSRWLRSAIVHSFLLDATASRPASLSVSDGVGVEVNATMPSVDADVEPELIGGLMASYPGATTVKVKVAEPSVLREEGFVASAEQDVARVRAVRQWFADQGVTDPKIRVDANAGWTVEQAFEVIRRLAADDVAGGLVDYVEQPCLSIDELAELRKRLAVEGVESAGAPVRIAADELIRKVSDPLRVVESGACDVAVVKVPPLGGVDKVVEVAEQVARHGVSLTVSSALDTAVGIGAGLHAAALVGQIGAESGAQARPNAAGLGTGSLFTADVARRRIADGQLLTGAVDVDRQVLQDYAVSEERRQWWLDRAAAAAEWIKH